MNSSKLKHIVILLVFTASLFGFGLANQRSALAYRSIIFPMISSNYSFSNDYNAPRNDSDGIHHATDIIAKKHTKLVAAATGRVTSVNYPQPDWGYSVTIRDTDGYSYRYIHMNDDNPGTNDGKGGGMHAYGPDMRVGNVVAKGQLVGYVGDSGHSNGISHLHFEMFRPNGDVMNPYESLRHAKHISNTAAPGRVTDEILPFGRTAKVPLNIAMGNLDLDPASEFVVAPAHNGTPIIKVYQDNETLVKTFYAYGTGYQGGVDVALGDVDLDGVDEIITVPVTGNTNIRVFEADGTQKKSFLAYPTNIKDGGRVAAGDVNGDGRDEVIFGLGPGDDPWVKVFNMSGTPTLLKKFLAYKNTFSGGVEVAAGNVNLTSTFDEIVVATNTGGSSQVRVFSAAGAPLSDFKAYDTSVKGVRVSVGQVRTGTVPLEIVTAPGVSGFPQLKLFNGTGGLLSSNYFIERWWVGGYDVGAGYGTSKATLGGNRRASIRPGGL